MAPSPYVGRQNYPKHERQIQLHPICPERQVRSCVRYGSNIRMPPSHQMNSLSPSGELRTTRGQTSGKYKLWTQLALLSKGFITSMMLVRHHLEGVLHRPAKTFMVSSRNRGNASVTTAHAVQDGLGVHLPINVSPQGSATRHGQLRVGQRKAIIFVENSLGGSDCATHRCGVFALV